MGTSACSCGGEESEMREGGPMGGRGGGKEGTSCGEGEVSDQSIGRLGQAMAPAAMERGVSVRG